MTLGQLLRSEVVTESGRSLGRLYDVRAQARGGAPRVVALAVGRPGVRERLTGNVERKRTPAEYVPLERVVRLAPGHIVIRDP